MPEERELIEGLEVATAEAVVVEETGPYTKIPDGWEVVIDLGDGSGVQKFSGKTKDEVSAKLIEAQTNATRKIRQQERFIKLGQGEFEPDREEDLPSFQPRTPSAEEHAQLIQDLQDPEKSAAAYEKLTELQLGAPINQVRQTLRRTAEIDSALKARTAGEQFAQAHSEFKQCLENGRTMVAYLEKRKWAPTVRNMERAYEELKDTGLLLFNEPEALIAPATIAAPAAVATTAVPAGTEEIPAIVRPRAVSGSTGVSSRSSSVRAGATPAQPTGLTREQLERMPSDEYKRRLLNEPGFRDKAEKLLAPRQ